MQFFTELFSYSFYDGFRESPVKGRGKAHYELRKSLKYLGGMVLNWRMSAAKANVKVKSNTISII